MGWSEGQALGKNEGGCLEPVSCYTVCFCVCSVFGIPFESSFAWLVLYSEIS
jgi:hypothetical protein